MGWMVEIRERRVPCLTKQDAFEFLADEFPGMSVGDGGDCLVVAEGEHVGAKLLGRAIMMEVVG